MERVRNRKERDFRSTSNNKFIDAVAYTDFGAHHIKEQPTNHSHHSDNDNNNNNNNNANKQAYLLNSRGFRCSLVRIVVI